MYGFNPGWASRPLDLEQQNAGREGGKDHRVFQGEGRNNNGPCWGVKEGVKTAGACAQAGVGPAWLCRAFHTGGPRSRIPQAGLAEEAKGPVSEVWIRFLLGNEDSTQGLSQLSVSQPCSRNGEVRDGQGYSALGSWGRQLWLGWGGGLYSPCLLELTGPPRPPNQGDLGSLARMLRA